MLALIGRGVARLYGLGSLRHIGTFAAALMALIVLASTEAWAGAYSDFFELANPPHFSLMVFGSGYGSDVYGSTHGGFQFDQTITRYVGLVGRVSAYQVYHGSGFDNPLAPAAKSATRNFGRFEGGIELTPVQGTSLSVMGGHDVGDSDAPVIDGDFSSWLAPHSIHPVNFSFSASHYYQNGVTSGRIDLRTIALSTADLMLLAGAGGAIWGDGSVGQAKGQGGPDIGIFIRDWHLSIDLQVGYGSAHLYGLVGFSRVFGWDE
jgi:hypothetical protein